MSKTSTKPRAAVLLNEISIINSPILYLKNSGWVVDRFEQPEFIYPAIYKYKYKLYIIDNGLCDNKFVGNIMNIVEAPVFTLGKTICDQCIMCTDYQDLINKIKAWRTSILTI